MDYPNLLAELAAEVRPLLGQGRVADYIPLLAQADPSRFGLALAALGDGSRPINVFWALGSLLGLNLLMLLGWLLGLLLTRDNPGALGRLWLWLSEKLARDASAAQLAPALLLMLQRQRLTRWGLGLMVNGLWALAMLAALADLVPDLVDAA